MAAGKEMEIAIKIAGKVESSFKNALEQAKNGLKTVTTTVTAATAAAAIAIGALGSAAVNVGMEFESAMSQVAATMLIDKTTEEGQQAFETLENAARQCGRETAFSAAEAAEALNYLALAGYDAEKAATALPTVLKLAGAGAMDLAAASDMVTDSMSALGIAATEENLTVFADQLAQTASKANTSVPQLGEAILTIGGTARDLAGGTTELNTALGILADNGIKASEGGTHLRNMILSLQNARNSDAAALFEQMGLSAYDAAGNMRSLGDVFGDLNASLAGASAEKVNRTLATIFKQTDLASARAMLAATADSVESLGTALDASLAESGNSLSSLGINLQEMAERFNTTTTQEQFAADMLEQYNITGEQAAAMFTGLQSIVGGTGNRFEELSGLIADSAGACEDMYAIQLDNLDGDISKLKSGLSDLGISIYKDLNAPLRDTVQQAAVMVGKLSQAYQNSGMEGMTGAVGSCLSEAMGTAATYVPQMVSMGIRLMGSLVQGVADHADSMSAAAVQTLAVFSGGLASLIPQVLLVGIDIITKLAGSIAGSLPQLILVGLQGFAALIAGLMSRLPEIAGVAIQIINGFANGIQDNLPAVIPAAMQALVEFSGSLRENAGYLVDAGLNLIMTLAQSLISNIPVFIETIPTIITNLAGIINDNAPKLLGAGIQLIIQLAVGIIQAIPVIIANIPAIIQAIVSVFTAFNWMVLGSRIITLIGNGIRTVITSIPQIFGNLVQTVRGVVSSFGWGSLGRGIITLIANGISSMITSIPQMFLNIGNFAIQAITSIDWWGVGTAIIQIIGEAISGSGEFILDAIKSIGGGIVNGIKGLFGESEKIDVSDSGASAVQSYAAGIESNVSAVSQAASELPVAVFGDMDHSMEEAAGMQAGEAYISGLNSGFMAAPVDIGGLGIDITGFTEDFSAAGATGAMALGTGISDNSQAVTQAVTGMGSDVNAALDGSWSSAVSGAETAMQQMSQIVTVKAQEAAQAVKSAFENMTITIPKPKIPVIGVSESSVSYGSGGSVSIPKFSVSWNALGGIFDRPTIFNTPSGMQGVGEAGPEAILPLDTLWSHMQDIVSQSIRENSEGSAVDDLLMSLQGAGNSDRTMTEPGGTEAMVIHWNPTYNLYGSAGKEEIEEADGMSRTEFEQYMNRWLKDHDRRVL